jgi:hypothetical protein
MYRVGESDLRIHTPLEELTLYQFGSMTAKHYFCPTCGTHPFARPSYPTAREQSEGVEPFYGWAVNTRCLDGFDFSDAPQKPIYGSRI